MAGSPSDRVIRQVHRLFNLGAVGTMSDRQLLDRFASRRDEATEAAFEELVIRHGPMVLRVCRSVLHDAHDAEDAFQAVFLVLANRAGSIRRSGSVASWLFGVAQRVAKRSKRGAARRRALNQLVAERSAESYLPVEDDPDWEVLQEEITRLPERLRAPIVVCYLRGLTYAAAAQELGLSEMAIRGRLARARERLRQRLNRRGVTVPGGLLIAGAARQTQVAIPVTLIQGTIRIALGFMAGNTAAMLARGVLNSMLLDQLRVATALLCFGIGGSYWAWHSVASAVDGKGQAKPVPAVVRAPPSSQPPRTDRYGDPLPPGAAQRLGTVRFRQAPFFKHIIHSPDGRLVVTDSGQHRLIVWDAQNAKELRHLDPGIEHIQDFAFSPDGKTIAAVGFEFEPKRNVVVNHLIFTEVARGRVVHRGEWDDQDNVDKVAYAADGKTVATVSSDTTLRLWDVATTTPLHQERLIAEGRVSPESIAFSPNAASRLLAIVWRQTIDLWDVARRRHVRSIVVDGQYRPNCVVFSPDGTTLAAGVASRGQEIRLWRVGDGSLFGRFKSRTNTHVSDMAFSPDGRVLAGVGSGGSLVFFDIATGKELDPSPSVRLADGPLAYSPDGKTLATTGKRETLHFWDVGTGQDRLATPEAHQGTVTALACLADRKSLVSGSWDETVRIWDLATGRPTKTLPHDGCVGSPEICAAGSLLATGLTYPDRGKIQVWNLKSGDRLRTWPVEGKGGSQFLKAVTLTEDGSSVIAALGDGSLRRLDVGTGQERPIAQPKREKLPLTGPGGGDGIERAVFSRDGRSVALIGGDFVQVFDIESGNRWFKEASGPTWVGACAFAPDGQSLALGRMVRAQKFQAGNWRGSSHPTSAIVWLDSRTGQARREIEVPESHVRSLAFSPDGQAIAVGTLLDHPARGIIRIFRLRDKQEIQAIESPCAWIGALCFTSDGKQVVAGLQDTSIVIWDVRPTNN